MKIEIQDEIITEVVLSGIRTVDGKLHFNSGQIWEGEEFPDTITIENQLFQLDIVYDDDNDFQDVVLKTGKTIHGRWEGGHYFAKGDPLCV